MNQVVAFQPAVENYGSRSLTAADVRAQVNLMQDVLQEVMQEGVHYGKIPGTNAKSLWKPGAEKIMATFKLAGDPETEDLSADGEIHYRVKLRLSTPGGTFVGAGIGECSSREEKYAWRAMVCQAEYDATPENRRRIKYAKDGQHKKQVRTNPWDVSNTILKMAKKRAQVDATLTATAASDIFTQDIEDLPPEVVAEIIDKNDRPSAKAGKPTDGAWEALTPEQREKIEKVAATVRDIMDNDDVGGAYDFIQKQGFDNDQKIALWGKLSSTIRTALKQHGDAQPKTAATNETPNHADDSPAAFERK